MIGGSKYKTVEKDGFMYRKYGDVGFTQLAGEYRRRQRRVAGRTGAAGARWYSDKNQYDRANRRDTGRSMGIHNMQTLGRNRLQGVTRKTVYEGEGGVKGFDRRENKQNADFQTKGSSVDKTEASISVHEGEKKLKKARRGFSVFSKGIRNTVS